MQPIAWLHGLSMLFAFRPHLFPPLSAGYMQSRLIGSLTNLIGSLTKLQREGPCARPFGLKISPTLVKKLFFVRIQKKNYEKGDTNEKNDFRCCAVCGAHSMY